MIVAGANYEGVKDDNSGKDINIPSIIHANPEIGSQFLMELLCSAAVC